MVSIVTCDDRKGAPMKNDTVATVTVTEAAKILGIGRNQAYAAAKTGELPTIRFGKRLVVPVAGLERLLQGSVPSA